MGRVYAAGSYRRCSAGEAACSGMRRGYTEGIVQDVRAKDAKAYFAAYSDDGEARVLLRSRAVGRQSVQPAAASMAESQHRSYVIGEQLSGRPERVSVAAMYGRPTGVTYCSSGTLSAVARCRNRC